MPSKTEKHFATEIAIATLFKKSTAEIEQHCRRDGMPHRGRKGGVRQFDLGEAVHWLVDYHHRQLEMERARRDTRSLDELASLLKVEPRTINKEAKERGLPRDERGIYALSKVIPWMVADFKKQLSQARAGGETDGQVKRRHWAASAALKELELAQRKGELARIDDFIGELEPALMAMRQILLGIPKHAARELSSKEIEVYLQSFINRTLDELASIPNRLKRVRTDTSVSAAGRIRNPQAAAGDDRKRMGGSKANAQRGNKRRKRAVGHK